MAEQGPKNRELVFFASDQRVKLQIDLTLSVHSPPPLEADCIATEIDPVKSQIIALDAKIKIAVGERCTVGTLNAEEFEQCNHGRQFIEIRVAQVDFSVPVPGVFSLRVAGHMGESKDLADRCRL